MSEEEEVVRGGCGVCAEEVEEGGRREEPAFWPAKCSEEESACGQCRENLTFGTHCTCTCMLHTHTCTHTTNVYTFSSQTSEIQYIYMYIHVHVQCTCICT